MKLFQMTPVLFFALTLFQWGCGDGKVQAVRPIDDKLLSACIDGSLARAKVACAEGANVNFISKPNLTPLTAAANANELDLVQFLLSRGANANEDSRPLCAAVSYENKEMITLLLNSGSKCDDIGLGGKYPLHFARNKEIIELLVSQGANVNAKSVDGNTAIHLRVLLGDGEAVICLKKLGARIDIPNSKGKTAIDLAESDEMRRLLLKQ